MGIFMKIKSIGEIMDIKIKKLMNEQDRDGRVCINPELAIYILENARYGNQRPISKRRVENHAHLMKLGQFNDYGSIRIGVIKNLPYLIDGYHRLHGVIKNNNGGINVHLHYEYFNHEDQLKEWYSTTDTEGRPLHDRIGMELRKKYNLLSYQVQSVLAASRALLFNFNYRKLVGGGWIKVTNQDLNDMVENNIHHFIGYMNLISENAINSEVRKRLLRAQYLALGAVTLPYDEGESFWLGTASDDGLKKGDPRKLFIEETKRQKGAKGTVKEKIKIHNVFARCWNAWIDGKELKVLTRIYEDKLIPLDGTDYEEEDNYDFVIKES
jgi:hypothetical protein